MTVSYVYFEIKIGSMSFCSCCMAAGVGWIIIGEKKPIGPIGYMTAQYVGMGIKFQTIST